jgi:two-component system sensor histidine kinase UhpB
LAKRAGAKRQQAVLRLTMSDDGKGIDSGTPKGFGLTTMTERVKSLRGSCVIDGARDKGTTIRIEIPVQREKTERARALELVGGMS